MASYPADEVNAVCQRFAINLRIAEYPFDVAMTGQADTVNAWGIPGCIYRLVANGMTRKSGAAT